MRGDLSRKLDPILLELAAELRGDATCKELQILYTHKHENNDKKRQLNHTSIPMELLVVSAPAINRSIITPINCSSIEYDDDDDDVTATKNNIISNYFISYFSILN